MQTFEGYFNHNGEFFSGGEMVKFPKDKKATVTVTDETVIRPVEHKTVEERQKAWARMQEICRGISIPEDFDYKKELAEARVEKYGRFD
jgi:hypothetical protein